MLYISFFISFIIFELFYFKVAKKYNIVDIPNDRSSHNNLTIRGIGVVFVFASLLFFIFNDFQYPFFILGLLLISTVSFMDDIKPLDNRYRIIAQFLSMGLLLFELQYPFPWFLLPFVLVVSVGIVNAYNFMDGINGITGGYSLLTIATLIFIQLNNGPFVAIELLTSVGISLLVFLFFNFRVKAAGFCGDAGSVSMAFILIFCISSLILFTGQIEYIFLLSLYGIDTVYTLIYRITQKQDIFSAHRLHFYQLLVHDYKWGHLQVSMLYVVSQLLVNILLINSTFMFYVVIAIVFLVNHYFRNRIGKGIKITT